MNLADITDPVVLDDLLAQAWKRAADPSDAQAQSDVENILRRITEITHGK